MTVRETVRKQYMRIVDQAAQQLQSVHQPAEGWLVALRKALGMSGTQVAARAGISRNAVYQAERCERDGAITLRQMQRLAEAMGGQFVYAVIPKNSVKQIIDEQAQRKAEALVRRASAHMALEKQSLTGAQTRERIDELANELIRDMPSDFWAMK